MTDALVLVHSIVRWFVLAGLLAVVVSGAVSLARHDGHNGSFNRLTSIAVGLLDVQVTLGLVLWVVAGAWNFDVFRAYLHPAGMLAALAVAHVGVARAKRGGGVRSALIGVGAALAVIVVVIPRDAWF